MSLRRDKAARLKVQVLDHTLKMIGKKSFDDLHVDDLCKKVKISKVTLFKYFPQKEDILLYFFRVWCLSRIVDLSIKPKEGLQGIYFLFDKIGEQCEHRPGMMLSLVGYLSDFKRSVKPFPIRPEEKKFLFPTIEEITSIEIQSVEQLLEKFILEAILKKEITKTTGIREIVNLLTSVFIGGIVTAHMHQLSAKNVLRKNVDLVMKGL
jgi:AcrR family transcriptional regulator